MPAKRGSQRGFTLIEVVVAFAIFALSIGAIFEVFAGATRRVEQARAREQLWLAAESVLSELRARPAPWPSQEEGQTGSGESWRVTIEPYDAGADPDHAWKAYSVSVLVGAAYSKDEITLTSIELAGSAP